MIMFPMIASNNANTAASAARIASRGVLAPPPRNPMKPAEPSTVYTKRVETRFRSKPDSNRVRRKMPTAPKPVIQLTPAEEQALEAKRKDLNQRLDSMINQMKDKNPAVGLI